MAKYLGINIKRPCLYLVYLVANMADDPQAKVARLVDFSFSIVSEFFCRGYRFDFACIWLINVWPKMVSFFVDVATAIFLTISFLFKSLLQAMLRYSLSGLAHGAVLELMKAGYGMPFHYYLSIILFNIGD
ncbi:hypothetical protein DSUL_260040 [Desulfovibrionales bacterium]